MSESGVTRDGVRGARPGREAVTGEATGRRRRRRGGRRGEESMVPEARFSSYYGMPVLKTPTWKAPDIAGYLFLGGLAGASSVLAAGAQLTGRPALARTAKLGSFGAVSASLVALVHDLGRPARFLNMLRVVKVTSPMSVGSWLLTGFGPLAGLAAVSDVTGRARPLGAAGTAGAAVLGPALATYTAVLVSDTAVPSWHESHRQLPFVFAGSAAASAAGLGLLGSPVSQAGPARRLAVTGAVLETVSTEVMKRRTGLAAEPFERGTAGRLMRVSKMLTAGGAALAAVSGRPGGGGRRAQAVAGAALLAGSAALRFGVFHAGVASAQDPKYTVVPQRERVRAREERDGTEGG